MTWLLYDSWCLETTDQIPEVLRRIEACVGDFDAVGPAGPALFEGTLYGNEFRLFRLARYKNLFLPLIRGKVLSSPGGAVVHVTLRPHGYALACLSIWYGLIILLPLYSTWSGQLEQGRWLALVPGVVIVAVLSAAVVAILFGYEARQARLALTEVVRGAKPLATTDQGRG